MLKHLFSCFTNTNSLNPQNNTVGCFPGYPHFTDEQTGSERLSNAFNVTPPVSGRNQGSSPGSLASEFLCIHNGSPTFPRNVLSSKVPVVAQQK